MAFGDAAGKAMEPGLTTTPDRIAAQPDQTAATALVGLVDNLTGVFHANFLALAEGDEPEPVHKARIALRRFRAVMAAFEPVLDEDLADALQDRSRALFRLLGAIRDADVMVARFAETGRAAEMVEEAIEQRRKGRKLLKKKNAAGFRDWAVKRLTGKRWRRTGKKAKTLREAPVAVLAKAALNRAWATCVSNGSDLHGMSARAQHDLRKDLKMLRYLSEAFADLWPGEAQDDFLATLRNLQDDLGELTDSAMAKSLGHSELPDTADPQARAADDWAALLRQGPWWR
jgi:CHAD domain-containing protein